jgi:hypothetical protein
MPVRELNMERSSGHWIVGTHQHFHSNEWDWFVYQRRVIDHDSIGSWVPIHDLTSRLVDRWSSQLCDLYTPSPSRPLKNPFLVFLVRNPSQLNLMLEWNFSIISWLLIDTLDLDRSDLELFRLWTTPSPTYLMRSSLAPEIPERNYIDFQNLSSVMAIHDNSLLLDFHSKGAVSIQVHDQWKFLINSFKQNFS